MDSDKFPTIIAWWDQVTLIPEDRRMIVFSKGTENGLKGWIPTGGHWAPTSTLGDRLLWKNAQKKEEKNITSDTMNKTIPHRMPVSTILVCKPWKVLSREISRHHWNLTSINLAILNNINDVSFK